jgi:hypothetical protein
MAGENSHLRFPKRASYVATPHQLAQPDAEFTHSPIRSRRNAERRQAGVLIVSTELQNSPLAQEASRRPRRRDVERRPGENQAMEHLRTDHAGRRSPLSTQISEEGRALLDSLDPEDPAYVRKRRGIIAAHTQVWEEHGATPLVIDFSDVQEPMRPERIHPSKPNSRHPEHPLYVWAIKQAHQIDPGHTTSARQTREQWYWDQMDRGRLPADFNPYAPGSQKHAAFDARTSLNDDRPTSAMFSNRVDARTGQPAEVLDTARQRRARARRKVKSGERMTDEEFLALYDKPIEQWDLEELARGRPKDKSGKFTGRAPSRYAQAEIRERIDTLFKQRVRGSMNETTVKALSTLAAVLDNDDIDFKGKPVVAASTKLDAAKFLVEHLLGRPTQRTETDISVKLSGILAGVMVSPEMALPTDPSQPVGPTGRYLAGQRGGRSDVIDYEVKALTEAGYIDPIIDAEYEEVED